MADKQQKTIDALDENLYKIVNDGSKGYFNFQNNEDLVKTIYDDPLERAKFLRMCNFIDDKKYPKVPTMSADGTIDYGGEGGEQHYAEAFESAKRRLGMPYQEVIPEYKKPRDPKQHEGFIPKMSLEKVH